MGIIDSLGVETPRHPGIASYDREPSISFSQNIMCFLKHLVYLRHCVAVTFCYQTVHGAL